MDFECGLAELPLLKFLIKDLKNDMDIIKSDLNNLNPNGTADTCKYFHTDNIINEIQQRQNRTKNLIAYNVPELNSIDIKVKINHGYEIVSNKIKDYSILNFETLKLVRLSEPIHDKIKSLNIILS